MAESFDGMLRGKTPLVIGAIVVVACLGVLLFISAGGTDDSATGSGKIQYYCDQCGATWTQEPTATPTCPECGAAAVTKTWCKCPRCGHVFCAVETRKLGPGRYSYRPYGQEEWQHAPPAQVSCPNCQGPAIDVSSHRVHPDGTPLQDRQRPSYR